MSDRVVVCRGCGKLSKPLDEFAVDDELAQLAAQYALCPDCTAKAPGNFYLVPVMGGTAPDIRGPYKTGDEQDAAAREIRAAQREDDAVFWLIIREGKPVIGTYTNGFFEFDTSVQEKLAELAASAREACTHMIGEAPSQVYSHPACPFNYCADPPYCCTLPDGCQYAPKVGAIVLGQSPFWKTSDKQVIAMCDRVDCLSPATVHGRLGSREPLCACDVHKHGLSEWKYLED